MDFVINMVVNLFQGFIVTWYLIKCLDTKKEQRLAYLIGTVATFSYLMIQSAFTNFEGMGILLFMGLSLIFCMFYLEGTVVKKLLYVVLLVFVLAFSSIIAASFVGIFHSEDFFDILNNKGINYYIAMVLNQLFLVIFLRIIVKMQDKTKVLFADKYIMLSMMIPVITIIVCAGILRVAEADQYKVIYIPIIVAALLAINLITIFLLMYEQKLCQKQAEDAIQMELYQHQKSDVEEIKKVFRETQKMHHETNKIMEMMQYLLDSGQVEQAKDYIAAFRKEENMQGYQIIYTDHAIINHMLNRKIEVCQRKNISVKCGVSGEFTGISEFDIHILLENLIDNAIEAAEQAVDKKISINMYGDQDGIGIEITNSALNPELKEGDGSWNTTKKNKYAHGYGLQNVNDIVYKYHGKINYVNITSELITCKVVLVKEL